MYLQHYQLKLMPFEIGPDPRFLWLGENHKEAFSILKYGILENKGFIVLVGEPGTGKTTLLNATVGGSSGKIRFAKIAEPSLNQMDFFNYAANALRMSGKFKSKADFLIHLKHFVSDRAAQSEKVVLVIDEAQRLTLEMLEQVRVLANFVGPNEAAISCIFAGQIEFLEMLKRNKALSQRIFFSYILKPLTEAETEAYITHRLTVAGAENLIFATTAMRSIHRLSGGNPRLINIICDQALLSGYAIGLKEIGPDVILKCTEDTLIPSEAAVVPEDFHNEGVPQGDIESKQGGDEAAVPAGRKQPSLPRTAATRRAFYGTLSAVIVLILFAFGYYLGAFDRFLSSTKPVVISPAARQNGGEKKGTIQKTDQAAEASGALDMARLQGQLSELMNQKSNLETQLKALQTKLDASENDRKELKIATARITELEGAINRKGKDLDAAAQKAADLEKQLDQERSIKDGLNADLSARAAAIAVLQKKIDSAASSQEGLKEQIETIRKENHTLQAQMVEMKSQKGTVEARLGDAQTQNSNLQAEAGKLKTALDRVAMLEAATSEQDKKFHQLQQKNEELTQALDKEKSAKAEVSAKLSSREAAIADFEKRLEMSRSAQQKLEADIQNVNRELARLQSQPQGLKAAMPEAPSLSFESNADGSDPAKVIDFVIKKKSQ